MSDTLVSSPSLLNRLVAARAASIPLATATAELKNSALAAIAASILDHADAIIDANDLDLANGRENGLSVALQDRLRLDRTRLAGLADAVTQIAGLVDPVGETVR